MKLCFLKVIGVDRLYGQFKLLTSMNRSSFTPRSHRIQLVIAFFVQLACFQLKIINKYVFNWHVFNWTYSAGDIQLACIQVEIFNLHVFDWNKFNWTYSSGDILLACV